MKQKLVEISSEAQNSPRCRFPEFTIEWKKKRLRDMVDVKAGYAFKSESMKSEKARFQVIKMSNIYKNELRLDRNPSYLTEIDEKQEDYLLRAGDTIITLTGTVGKQDFGYSAQITENHQYLLNQRLLLLRQKALTSDNLFIRQLVSTEMFLYHFFSEAKGGTGNQTNVGIEDVKNIAVYWPEIHEQQKISTFLTAVDDKIQLLSKKKALLEQYKKGVMQQIFNQEIRFKDENGSEYPEWEIKRARDIFVSHTNKNHSGDLPILAITQDKGVVLRSSIGIDIQSSEASVRSYKIVERGNFIISLRSFQGGIEYSNVTGICSPAYTVLKSKIEMCAKFFRYYLKKDSFIRELSSSVVGIRDGKQISFDVFSTMKLPFPSVKEQMKIASFLSALDDKIKHVDQQIELTKHYKKGLLQQMFV